MAFVDIAFLWLAFLGMFAIINPFSTALVFLGLSAGDTKEHKKYQAKKAAIVSTIVLILFMICGTVIFDIFSITIDAFRIAGGILVAKVGFNMLSAKDRQSDEEKKESKKKRDISVIPLAIPMLSGPGAITVALVWTSQAPSVVDKVGLMVMAALIFLISYFILIHANILKKVLGQTGTNVLERLMGLIVLVMGIQFILNAAMDIVPRMIAGG